MTTPDPRGGGSAGRRYDGALTDPRTGRPRPGPPAADARAVRAAVRAARDARPAWAALTPRERSGRLLRFADAVEARADAYVSAERAGTGKPLAEVTGEVGQCIDLIRFYAGAVRAGLAPAGGHLVPGRESWVRWEPLGVVGVVVPWNYPLMMATWRFAPALAAGNTVVLKPAETTPDSALLAAEDAAGTLGPGVLLTLPGDRATGRLLVEADVDAIAFTGSHTAGADVLSRAGVRRVSLELGGNCPALVLPDAPEDTYRRLAEACTYNAGQSCAAPARVITLAENHDETVERLAEAMRQRTAGTDFGPLNSAGQLARYDRIISSSRARTVRTADAAVRPDESEGYWRPGLVLADLPPDAAAVTEEVFGPALTVQSAAGEEEAVRMANSSAQALAASVWSTSAARGLGLARELDAGEVWINCHLEQTPELPHGGRKQSGHGTDLSVLALGEYQRPKTITVALS
ncbi:aldehyde dehydrogenase family protein [Streptomyces sp. NPDC021020]|uniref:aldehyde dehydrogenase family protein n=1 Tax=Streptomyces sp. NPDC021020 TaxID=3365109 RepID=UPI003789FE9C